MDPITLSLLLDYLYNKFAITFVFSLIGTTVKEVAYNNKSKIRIKSLLASSTFSTVLLCAIGEYFSLPFSVYALVCMLVGIWSGHIFRLATNSKFMTSFIQNLLKRIASPFTGALSDTIQDTKSKTKDKNDKKDTPEEDTDGK